MRTLLNVPKSLRWLEAREDGKRWIKALPKLVASLAGQWGLEVGEAYPAANVAYVAKALQNNRRVVLKVQWPHSECRYEADALERWDGHGAVRLLARDFKKHALLLERCVPGTHLSQDTRSDPIAVLIGLLPRLWQPAGIPFESVSHAASTWVENLPKNWELAGRPCERQLVDAAIISLRELSQDQGEQVLVHQDLHGDNILAAEREPWSVIDPKPLSGEREFALAPIIRSPEFGHSKADVLRRLDRLSEAFSLDRSRVRGWTIGQTMAWAFGGPHQERHLETARWLLSLGP